MKISIDLDKRSAKKNNVYPLKIRITGSSQVEYLHSGFSLTEKQWTGTEVTNHSQKLAINSHLSNLKGQIERAYALDPSLTPKQLKAIVKSKGKPVEEKGNLTAFIDQFIKEIEQGKVKRAANTLKTLKTTKQHLENYKAKILFSDIDREFYFGYKDYLRKEGNNLNSTGKQIAHLKMFLNEAIERGLTENREHQKKYFKVDKEEPPTDYLTSKEIEELHLKAMPNKRLTEARDRFVLNCCLGLRISDFSRLSPEDIQTISGKKFIRKVTVKTGKEVVIPVSKLALTILKAYDYSLPVISDQKNNEFIKEVCKHAGINKKVTNHTARRSFATNAFLAGVPALNIMAITGHRTEKSFMRYIRAEALEAALAVKDHAFFK